MNGWSFSEIKRQIEYKAKWNGITVIQLSKKETRGTSTLCPRCGKRLQDAGEAMKGNVDNTQPLIPRVDAGEVTVSGTLSTNSRLIRMLP